MLETSPQSSLPSRLCGPDSADLIRSEVLADLFEATATRTPDKIALIFAERELSYGELNAAADRVASRLIADGVRPGHIVGLWLPRGIDLLVMQLGIAKSGAAWLPFDADTPIDRIKVCLDDADSTGLVTIAKIEDFGHRCWLADDLQADHPGPLNHRHDARPSDPAYVIYTSGSTGKPKGILINQGAICHFLRSENVILGINEHDRVYQGFSVAFDMSFEEIWISYLAGATLWLAPKEVATDPEALPIALIDNRVSVLHAVPTLLALFTCDVPGLRLINLGGEACPQAIVDRWAGPGRQVFNTYGPTEATVSASLAELHPGQPVTIGRPLPNYGLLVIDAAVDYGLRLLPQGETGELCITGPGVAAGYLGRPDLTAEKFLDNPWAANPHESRLYRTGDLARIDESGQIHCLGRTDDQVKIRGFRVELGEIEAALTRQPGVGTAAVILRQDEGIERLVAYLIVDDRETITGPALRSELAKILPPYMVPSQVEMLAEMPRLTSGKIDRKALRARPLELPAGAPGDSDTPESPAEEILFAALTRLFPGQAIKRGADFFADLGGHSLLAARLASTLRQEARFAGFSVRDIYVHRRLGLIAAALDATVEVATDASATEWTPPPTHRRWLCGLAQALVLPPLVGLRMGQWLAPFFTYHYFTGDPGDSIAVAVAISAGVFLIATLLGFVFAIVGKWLIAGRLKAGSYPLWGLTYFRWWCANRLIEGAPVYMLSSSPLNIWWLRALGARIGSETIIGNVTLRVPELLQIGDGVSIGNAANLENARVERGQLHLGSITIEDNVCIGSYAVVEGNTKIGCYGHLEAQSALSEGQVMPPRRIWLGSPARDIGEFDPESLPPRPEVSETRLAREGLFYVLGMLATATIFFMPVFPSFMLVDWLDVDPTPEVLSNTPIIVQLCKYFALAFPGTAVLIVGTILSSALLRWTLMPRLQAGSWPIHSRVYCSRWLVNQIQESSLNILHGIYATVYAPFWYRLLGAKVGRDAEISTAQGLVPDLLTLGDETFIADAVMLGDEEVDGGWMTMKPTVVSRRSFVGNGAYIPDGTTLPENVLIGVQSRAPANERMQPGDTWLGSPPINLPAREQTAGYPEALTFRPSPLRRLGRAVVEAFRIISPHALVIAVGYTVVINVMPLAEAGRWRDVCALLTGAGVFFSLSTIIFVAVLKWLCIWRYKTHSVPMWTPFVWTSEAITSLYVGMAVPNLMNYLRGTPWLPLALNMLGCRIGRGVYLDTTDVTEFDCVRIGDYSELNSLACPQTHLFEDRVMKIDLVDIGQRVYVGPRTTILYGAVVGDNVRLGPLSLVMKGESLPAGSSWSGCPAAPASR
ncbi:Pls/PosA family non-ribosomal peptide synthetase [Dechloromonas sp. HYN0024]|uniref:Pls/PosA family non-ribosomal peptide synthetase n=1 Tax=Dechloromonas sp. HYN0024 TaxID=2231055 RepID=UPI000E44FF74|nr:Pls/PosA family non-ribosomal peptide synthetase [Dechloromonas sp. HYN0024]AXS78719.1 amino acid adenylation domain-containing protein [Dechloromonas sp. HYN0024]